MYIDIYQQIIIKYLHMFNKYLSGVTKKLTGACLVCGLQNSISFER